MEQRKLRRWRQMARSWCGRRTRECEQRAAQRTSWRGMKCIQNRNHNFKSTCRLAGGEPSTLALASGTYACAFAWSDQGGGAARMGSTRNTAHKVFTCRTSHIDWASGTARCKTATGQNKKSKARTGSSRRKAGRLQKQTASPCLLGNSANRRSHKNKARKIKEMRCFLL